MVLGWSLTLDFERLCICSPLLVKLVGGGLLLVKLAEGGWKNHGDEPKVVAVPLVVLEEADSHMRC